MIKHPIIEYFSQVKHYKIMKQSHADKGYSEMTFHLQRCFFHLPKSDEKESTKVPSSTTPCSAWC